MIHRSAYWTISQSGSWNFFSSKIYFQTLTLGKRIKLTQEKHGKTRPSWFCLHENRTAYLSSARAGYLSYTQLHSLFQSLKGISNFPRLIFPVIPLAPPRPATPEKFTIPHRCARFGPGGHLVQVLPNLPSAGQPALVDIHSLEVHFKLSVFQLLTAVLVLVLSILLRVSCSKKGFKHKVVLFYFICCTVLMA